MGRAGVRREGTHRCLVYKRAREQVSVSLSWRARHHAARREMLGPALEGGKVGEDHDFNMRNNVFWDLPRLRYACNATSKWSFVPPSPNEPRRQISLPHFLHSKMVRKANVTEHIVIFACIRSITINDLI